MSEYHSNTLQTGNIERLSLLPCFPSSSSSIEINQQQQQEKTLLLLPNIPGKHPSNRQDNRGHSRIDA